MKYLSEFFIDSLNKKFCLFVIWLNQPELPDYKRNKWSSKILNKQPNLATDRSMCNIDRSISVHVVLWSIFTIERLLNEWLVWEPLLYSVSIVSWMLYQCRVESHFYSRLSSVCVNLTTSSGDRLWARKIQDESKQSTFSPPWFGCITYLTCGGSSLDCLLTRLIVVRCHLAVCFAGNCVLLFIDD